MSAWSRALLRLHYEVNYRDFGYSERITHLKRPYLAAVDQLVGKLSTDMENLLKLRYGQNIGVICKHNLVDRGDVVIFHILTSLVIVQKSNNQSQVCPRLNVNLCLSW